MVLVLGLTGLYVAVAPSMTPITPFDLFNDKRLLQVGILLVAAALAPGPRYAFLEVGHFLFALVGIVVAAVRRAPEYTEALLLGAVVLSAGLYAVHFGVSYGLSVAWPALEVGRETISGFANIRHFNQYQTWTLPLLGGAVLALPRRWRVGACLAS